MKLIKSSEELSKGKKEHYKGRVYRYREQVFINEEGSIEVRMRLRPLKRLSCKGCEKCDWVDEFLQETIDWDGMSWFDGLENNKRDILEGKWIPGPYEYPQDGDLEIRFVPYPENPNTEDDK